MVKKYNLEEEIDRQEINEVNFDTFSSRENDSRSAVNAKRVAGALAVAGAVFAGGCEASQSGEVRPEDTGGRTSSELVPHGPECLEHPDAVFTTGKISTTDLNTEKLGYLLRDTIKLRSTDYSDFEVNFDTEQVQQFEAGTEIVKSSQTDPYSSSVRVTILNSGGWDGLNIDRSASESDDVTFEGDLCISDGKQN